MWRLRRESSGEVGAPPSTPSMDGDDRSSGDVKQTDRALMRLEERILTALRENEARLQATMTDNSANMLSIKGDVQLLRRRCAALEASVGAPPPSSAPGGSMASFFAGSPTPRSDSWPSPQSGDAKPSTALNLSAAASSPARDSGSGATPLATPSAAIGAGDGTGGAYRQQLPSCLRDGGGGSSSSSSGLARSGSADSSGGNAPAALKPRVRVRRLGQRERRESVTAQMLNDLDPKQQAWALVESDTEIRGMLKDLTRQIKDHADKVERTTTKPTLADANANGTLFVLLTRATNLKAMDSNGFSDPYAKLNIGSVVHKSKTIRKTLNPMWHETFEFEGRLSQLLSEPMSLRMFDYDFASMRDDLLGTVSIDFSANNGAFFNGVRRDFAQELDEPGTPRDAKGKVFLQVWWIPASDEDNSRGRNSTYRFRRSTAAGGEGDRFTVSDTISAVSSLPQLVRAACFRLVPKPCRKPKRLCQYVCGRVLHPDERFRSAWNICLAFFIIYCGAAVPLEIGFETDMVQAMCKLGQYEPQLLRHECTSYLLWFWLNFVVDLFFICDIVINFRTGYVHEGHFVSDDWLVARAYMKGSFVMDVLGTFPLNVVMMIANPSNPYGDDALVAATSGGDAGSAGRANRMLRLMRMAKLAKLARMRKLAKYMENFEEVLNPGVLAVFKLVFIALFCCHLFGCLWWMVSDLEISMSEDEHTPWISTAWYAGENTWHPPRWLKFESSIGMKYVHSFFWGAGMVTSLVPRDIEPLTMLEGLVTTFTMFFGLMLNAYVISSLTQALASMNSKKELTGKQLNDIKQFLLIKGVTTDLRSRILEYYEYLFTSSAALDSSLQDQMNQMPQALSAQLALSTNRRLAARCAFFREVSDASLLRLISELSPLVFVPNQMIVKEGLPLSSVYFINRGLVQILVNDVPQGQLTNHENFGLDDYLASWDRGFKGQAATVSRSAQSITYCDVMGLQTEMLNEVLAPDLKFQRRLQERIDGVDSSDDLARSLCRRTLSRGWNLRRAGTKGPSTFAANRAGSCAGSSPKDEGEPDSLRARSVVMRLGKSIMSGGAAGTSQGSSSSRPGGSSVGEVGDDTQRSTGGTLRAALLRGAARMELGHSNVPLGKTIEEARRDSRAGSGDGGQDAELQA